MAHSRGGGLALPIVAAAMSPQLQWRDNVYIVAGLAGVIAMCLMLIQPLMAGGYLPGPSPKNYRRIHRWVGGILVVVVVIHVAGLWITSPPDVVDALLFTSPTPFSFWGVIAMWAVFITALMASLRKPLRLRIRTWRIIHMALAVVIVVGSVVHAMLIEGTMEILTKAILCVLVLVAALKVIVSYLSHISRVN